MIDSLPGVRGATRSLICSRSCDDVHVRRVDHELRRVDHGAEQLALFLDRVREARALVGQRMLAASLAEARQEHLVVGLEEHDLARDRVRSQLLHERRNLRDVVAAAIARIEADADVLERRVLAQQQLVDERAKQRRRDVVDAVEAEILERVQRDALAGAGQAADDHEAHELSLAWSWRFAARTRVAGVSARAPSPLPWRDGR